MRSYLSAKADIRSLAIALLLATYLLGCDKPVEPDAPLFTIPQGIVADDATWEVLVEDHPYSDSPAADAAGNIYYSDIMTNRIMKWGIEGELEVFAAGTAMTQGLVYRKDGSLIGCRAKDGQIVRYLPDASYEVLAQGEATAREDTNIPAQRLTLSAEYCNDLALSPFGGVWFTDRINEQILYLDTDGTVRRVAGGFRGNGIELSLDKKLLAVTDSERPVLHAFRVGDDGSLEEIPGYFEPLKIGRRQVKSGEPVHTGANGMTIDSEGRFYVPTFIGVQVFASNGRRLGVIRGAKGYMSNLGFGGADHKWLFATGNSLARLRMDAAGAAPGG